MNQSIIGYHKDEEDHWVAELNCGHFQHVRHKPPFINRPWVVTQQGRESMLGEELNCKKCDSDAPKDKL
ncbi:MAG: GNAT family acetyltransferase [Rickettsiales bacterium]|nr:GNAT family acetyltransferase [Rickettsiales bacterium]